MRESASDAKVARQIAETNERSARDASSDALKMAEEAAKARGIAESETRRAKQATYVSDMRLAAAQIEDGLNSEAMDLLLRHATEDDICDWEWDF